MCPQFNDRASDTERFAIDRALLHLGGPAGVGWGNLGLWDGAPSYAEACEALAALVGRAAHVGAGSRVLEVACGHGDGLSLWLEKLGAAAVTGVEIDALSVEAARERIASLGLDGRAHVVHGSASALAGMGDAEVDAVVAVDAAYHFDPRQRFFDEAWRVLAPGGRLALTDLALVAAPSPLARPLLGALAAACAIPAENLDLPGAYAAGLERAGFTRITVEKLDDRVLGGFAEFARRHRRAHLGGALDAGWAKILATGWAAGLAHREGWMHYLLVSAEKA